MLARGVLTLQKTGKKAISPQPAVFGIKTEPLRRPGKKGYYGAARSGSQVNGQIALQAAQVAKKIALKAEFSPKRPGPLRNRDNLVEPGTILQQLGSLVPDGNHDPGLRIIFPQRPDAGGRENDIADIAELHKQNAAR